MRPTLEANGLTANLLQYLSTTYALSDEGARRALEAFLGDTDAGMFRGPFLRIRTPFQPAPDNWRDGLDWPDRGFLPPGFTPYAHQAAAFHRLSSRHHPPLPTLVTTGTGSGKTEAFLLPILDHCRRERALGRAGVKAVLLYPMNALASDQADRLNHYLQQDAFSQVTAGLFIGDTPDTPYPRVMTRRSEIRNNPPDLLVTNFKMLDLLLHRADDAPLWADADLRYVVVDEFHAYDGAQGTDVAMLLRRLAARVGAATAEMPLGGICPVATSATLASPTEADTPGDAPDLLAVAGQIFGTRFTADAVISENRRSVEEFIPQHSLAAELPLPDPETLAALPDPGRNDEAMARLSEVVTGQPELTPEQLGAVLRTHVLTRALLTALADGVRDPAQILDVLWRHNAYSWGRAVTERPQQAALALARFVALLSVARDPDADPAHPRPLVHVEVHQWARSVTRLLRGILPWPEAEFRWDAADPAGATAVDGDRAAPVTTATGGQRANVFLPAVYCRECGRSGWAAFSPESDDAALRLDPVLIRRASTSRDKMRVRALIAATDAEAREGAGSGPMAVSNRAWGGTGRPAAAGLGGVLMVLDGAGGRLRPPQPSTDYHPETGEPTLTARDSAFVLVILGQTANTAATGDWCPACGERNAIRYLGTRTAALAAAALTQLFTGGELDDKQNERKTLMFSDSVQDAAHRAGFVANRSYVFSLRALLVAHLSESRDTALNDLIADVVAATTDLQTLAAVVPPDLHDRPGVDALLAGENGGTAGVWQTIGERLAFAALMEFGFRSRQGRTLELTRTAAAQVSIPNKDAAIALVRQAYLAGTELPADAPEDARYLGFLRIFLERMRWRGAVRHRWLTRYALDAGVSRYFVWGRRPAGMPAFPAFVAAPVFLLDRPRPRSEFDFATGRLSWHERWAQRSFGLTRDAAAKFWERLLPALASDGLLATRVTRDGQTRLYGLQPGAILVRGLTDDEVNVAAVRCPVCAWEQTVHPALLDQWRGQPCPSYRCARGRLEAANRPAANGSDPHRRDRDYRDDYYRRLYRGAGTYQIVTAEHTGMLTRPQRERVEKAFKAGGRFTDPNVLSCTPTLELGIDIGDLSAIVLASLPPSPAHYAQRVGRAGRRTGNAYVLTVLGHRQRDLYFLDRPVDMIAGRIIPPGCYLSAVEILRRQYLAHLLDLAAAGRLPAADGGTEPLRPLPRTAPALFGDSGYLVDLVATALAHAEELLGGFLALFPGDTIEPRAVDELRAFATAGLRSAVDRAVREWRERLAILAERLSAITATSAALNPDDPEQAQQRAELDGERRGIGALLARAGEKDAPGALVELGLLPNYALVDTRTVLEATLYAERRAESDETERSSAEVRYRTELREYDRPRRLALTELAPGNTFYVNGYRHEVTGLEIGTRDRPGWQVWRCCPECGYVRTTEAESDRTPCPRCRSGRIADDGSCLHRVVEPSRVTARDRREDARIRDDRDDRDPRFYETVTAVDIPQDTVELSWRHERRVFGIDFTRDATIRTLNLGPARFDVPARDLFAGQLTRVNPFTVCTGCGAAGADGAPVFDQDSDALLTSGPDDPRLRHHRPWCPLRQGRRDDTVQLPVLLAHQLKTEALRILLPAATVLVEERVHSFRAALRLGVDRHFGGDPDHLDTAIATMPDQNSGERRSYLVLYDTLPGGTGYLHRLTDPVAFKATLAAARAVLAACPCAAEGRRACHRCLHRYTPDNLQQHASRRTALELIDGLLTGPDGSDGWDISDVGGTDDIGLDQQVESDLEARFLALLRTWSTVTTDTVLEENSATSGHLRFTGGADVVHWRLTAQQPLDNTRPDFSFHRVDGPPCAIQVYLDGRRFHASTDNNRLARDAVRRTRLRSTGNLVFQLTWDDLDLFEERADRAQPVWPPYLTGAQDAAKAAYAAYEGDRSDFADTVLTNPVETLLAFLRDPDLTRWTRRARALVAGAAAMPGTVHVGTAGGSQEVSGLLRQALWECIPPSDRPDDRPTTDVAQVGGSVHLFRATDTAELPLVLVVDERSPEAWTALAVVNDLNADLDSITAKHTWRAWLYWSNLIQFLSLQGRADGVQLTASQTLEYPVEQLAIAGGVGELSSMKGSALVPYVPAPAEPVNDVPAGPTSGSARDPGWDVEILPYLDEQDSALARLARTLAERGKRVPVFGYELGQSGWPADFAWSDSGVRIAVVTAPHDADDDEARRRDAAYAEAGWTVRTAADWNLHLESLLAVLPDAAEPTEAVEETHA
ncbi:DEAD/DEAH box helicase [Cryptosporangium arvum]|uniref:Helicase family protein with metal-binding cysteine cluster n=1 Tax=Cryptosporangium arvum DSM 44712 TaxID=927661 RepID=A0A010ZXS4_9ACTN|nr:DEAD/DEAH box helicase [Cryptosporangium arvum]EXG82022.1 helicase family protein with metal-binding cysteine cluster [Cryptosporangium arvum DSM 44712]